MDDEAVEIMYSEESEASQLRLLKSIENWASKESQRSELEMTGFGAALSNDLVNFEKFTAKDCRQCPKLIGALSAVKQHLDKQFKKFDSEIDKMHIKFAQEMEELDLKIIRDRKEFKRYLISLIYAQEYDRLRHDVENIYEALVAKSKYEDIKDMESEIDDLKRQLAQAKLKV
tara:strand:- start:382 stop:900 length:519 start_codon:yes stop_codon:yes gene_type:complete